MPLPLEQFVKHLEDSGILDSDTLRDFVPPKGTPKDAEELAKDLVRKKKLTKFQAEEVYRGKGKALVLGNYTILDKIGAGGMGQVFKAEHRRMHRIVAVKTLPAAMMKNAAVVARFEREVTAAARLNHPNIVIAYDADNANGVHLLVMEYVEGSDLAATVKKNGPLSVEKTLNYILQAARGLEAAHAEGIVHRDIKPANLLLDKKGTVKILDMGLARIGGEGPGQADLTSTGAVMGTVDYMAPEQALNTKTADARADIYSLGCSLFYLLTGKATYDGDTLMAKLLAHRDQPIPSIRAALPDAPQQLETVFSKMVAKKIEDRYQTVTAAISDLERLASGQQPVVETRMSKAKTIETPAKEKSSSGSRVETGLTDFLNDVELPPPVTVRSVKRRKAAVRKDWFSKNRKLTLIGAGGLGAVILLAGIIFSLRTKEGTLVVKVSEPDAEVQVLSEEGKVEITRPGEKGTITIAVDPGKHRLKVQKNGFELFTDNFEIESGTKASITARLVPLEAKPAIVAKGDTSSKTGAPAMGADLPRADGNGWVSLFNGKDLTGWKTHPEDKGQWDVKDGILIGSGPHVNHLFTERADYKDFRFRVEARISDLGNSGQYFRVAFEKSFPPGYEAQINSTQPDIKTGSLYNLVQITEMLVKPDEWFTQEVVAEGNHIRILVNGKQVVDYVDLKNTYTTGHLALQHNRGGGGRDTVVEFRKIEVQELPISKTPANSSPFDALQGTWISLREEVGGRPANYVTEKRFVFTDRKMIMTRKSSGTFGKYEGTFKVEANSSQFDFTGTDPGGNPVEFRGIYKIDGDSLTLCYKYVKDNGTTRPIEFKTDDKQNTAFVLVELKRPTGSGGADVLRTEGWNRLDPYWKITPQEITGSTGKAKLDFNTYLCSNRSYRDFELTCQVWLKKNNSGVQIRSECIDQKKWILRGPQVDMGSKYWGSLYGEQTTGMMQAAPADFEQRFVKPDEFNDVWVRCVGKHVTIKVNGQTSVDGDFQNMADEGIIGLQLHSGETEVVFRNIRLVEVVSGKSPPADATVFEGHAYKFFPDVLTWHQAKSRCEELGGHLAIVTSDAENKFVNDFAKKGIPNMGEWDGAWLGATDEQKEGDWRWIDGNPLEFSVWGPGQPNNKENNEHYLLLFLPQGVWSDQPAKSVQHRAYFVCEWEKSP